jgi:hypothetical protein
MAMKCFAVRFSGMSRDSISGIVITVFVLGIPIASTSLLSLSLLSLSIMVSALEGAVYGASALLSTLVGALGINTLSRVPGLESLKHLSITGYALYSTLTGLGILVALIIYRWPYMERSITFGQLKGKTLQPVAL